MSFISILFNGQTDYLNAQNAEIPSFFTDLNLDQIVDAITTGWTEYDLKPFFDFSLSSIDEIQYRQEVFRDLENESLYAQLKFFSERMREARRLLTLSEKLYYKYQKEIWFLYSVEIYCEAVKQLVKDLSSVPLKSRGFLSFGEYLMNYTSDIHFTSLAEESNMIKGDLEKVKYRIIIKDNAFTVQNFVKESDYSAEIDETFEKFKSAYRSGRQGAVNDYRVRYKFSPEVMNHVEAKILEFVTQLNPDLFSRLDNFCMRHMNLPAGQASFIDATIAGFDREIHFYIAYLEHIEKFKRNNLHFCYPLVVNTTKEIFNYEGFDLALAQKLNGSGTPIVCNDFYLKGKERVIVVTGPNQGGKTTFARTFGQLHYLASIGCPVQGREAQLFFFDKLFTQFERVEKVENLRGKLEDDLTRIHSIFESATSRSVIIMNEIFNSTTLQDVSFLTTKILEKILKLDLFCVWVTFVDELASFSEQTVSMTSTIVPGNPALRTFKIVRRPADGLAYALAIAEKYRLTFNSIRGRIGQ